MNSVNNSIPRLKRKKNEDPLCNIIKCVIKRPNGEEIWIKKEGDVMNDYEVFDKIIDGGYYLENMYFVDL